MAPVVRFKTNNFDSSLFGAGFKAINSSGKSNLNFDNFIIYLCLFYNQLVTEGYYFFVSFQCRTPFYVEILN